MAGKRPARVQTRAPVLGKAWDASITFSGKLTTTLLPCSRESQCPRGNARSAVRPARGGIEITFLAQHTLHVVVDQANVLRTIDGMQPDRLPAKQDQDYIRQRTGPQASGNRQVKTTPDPALFPLALEFIERHRR